MQFFGAAELRPKDRREAFKATPRLKKRQNRASLLAARYAGVNVCVCVCVYI